MFSGFYIALLLILALLIVRVVSFEWREKSEDPRWRAVWLWMNTVGSVGASFIWGVALANLLHGVPLNSSHQFSGDFLDLFSAYTVLAGVTVVCLFALHGATYLSLRTDGDLRERAAATARRLSIPAAVLAVAFLAWTVVVAHNRNSGASSRWPIPAALAALALLLAVWFIRTRHEGGAFATTGLGAIGIVATIFTGLYPRVLVSHPTLRQQPHDLQRRHRPLRPKGDHDRGRHLYPDHPPLPGMDLLRLPQTAQRRASAQSRRRRHRPHRASGTRLGDARARPRPPGTDRIIDLLATQRDLRRRSGRRGRDRPAALRDNAAQR